MSDTTTASSEAPVITPVQDAHHEPAQASGSGTERRSLAARLFSIGAWQLLLLIFLSVVVGMFLLALDFSADRQGLDIGGAILELAETFFSALFWLLRTFWKPFLAGAAIVFPVWLLWRLVSLPFRK